MPKDDKKKTTKDASDKVQKARRAVEKLKEEIRANREAMKDTTRLLFCSFTFIISFLLIHGDMLCCFFV